MPSKPRLSKVDRQLHRFYEPLVLLAILSPSTGRKSGQFVKIRNDSQNQQSIFLDQLAWICDFKTGGETVSAIAAEAHPSGPIYWLAAPGSPSEAVSTHLDDVLRELRKAHACSETQMQSLEAELTSRCVVFSWRKVKHYRKTLKSRVERCKKLSNTGEQREYAQRLISSLENLIEPVNSDLSLCELAYEFRSTDLWEQLTGKNGHNEDSAWSETRHYIGRLGAWSKAVKALVSIAADCPCFVDGCSIEQITVSPSAWQPQADSLTTLESALKRMLPAGSEDNDIIFRQLQDIRIFDVGLAFKDEYTAKTFKPRVHAETALLEHFYQNDRRHLNEYRYIGCSKPSCYSCDLYFQFHPGHYEGRSCHGNVWKNWCAPLLSSTDRREPIDDHTRKILDSMTARIRSDVLFLINTKASARRKLPDSTTGISSAVLGANGLSGRSNQDTPDTESFEGMLRHEKPPEVTPSSDTDHMTPILDSLNVEPQLDLSKGESNEIDEDEDEEIIVFQGRKNSSRHSR